MEILKFFATFFSGYFLGALAVFIWACTDQGHTYTSVSRIIWDHFNKDGE